MRGDNSGLSTRIERRQKEQDGKGREMAAKRHSRPFSISLIHAWVDMKGESRTNRTLERRSRHLFRQSLVLEFRHFHSALQKTDQKVHLPLQLSNFGDMNRK